jgi:hypothetical protein
MKKKILLLPYLLASYFFSPSAMGAEVDATAQRDLFMKTVVLTLATSKELTNQQEIDQAIADMKEIISIGKQLDPEFLEWIDPGMPAAFSKLIKSMQLRSEALEAKTVEGQLLAQKPWLEWGAYWNANDEKIYKKLKVE